MDPKYRRYAPIGLYLAGAAAIASFVIYFLQRQWNLPLQISLAMVIVGLAVFTLLDPERVRMLLSGRQAKYGSNALVLSLAFIGILIITNYLVYQNTKRWDLTEDKQYTLSQETLDTLNSLPEKVMAQAFFTGRMSPDRAKEMLEQYKFHGKGKFDYVFIDPEEQPVLAQEAKVTRDGTIVLRMGEHQEQVTIVTEQEITNALVRLLNPEERVIYFLTGHGEYSPEDMGDKSYSRVKIALEAKNYTVQLLNLLASNKVPEDAEVIVIAGPRKPLAQNEVDLLSTYVGSGGGLVVMCEPSIIAGFTKEEDPLAQYLGQTWGIDLGEDMVVDLTSNQAFAPYAAQYGSHAITNKLERLASQFPTARSVSIEASPPGTSSVEIILTAGQSWAETNLSALESDNPQIEFNEEEDRLGPLPLAVAAENFENDARVVVIGDSDFAIDANFIVYANGDVLINSIDWASGQENLINLTPKSSTQRMLVPPQQMFMNLILLSMVIVLPGLALLASILVWIQRRRRG